MSEKHRILRNAERRVSGLVAEAVSASRGFQASFLELIAQRCGLDVSLSDAEVDLRPEVFGEKDGYDFALRARAAETRVAFLVTVAAHCEAAAAARAREAAQRARSGGVESLAFTALIAAEDPPASAAAPPGWTYDAVLRFGEIRPFLHAQAEGVGGEFGRRLAFQLEGFDRAERAIRGVLSGALGPVTFRDAYLDFVATTEAALPVAAAAFAGEEAGVETVVFDAEALPRWDFMPRPRLAHHLATGLVSILIERWGEQIEALAGMMEPTLAGTDLGLATARSAAPGGPAGLLIVAEVPMLDPGRGFAGQRAAARECLQTAVALKRWWIGRKGAARYWAEAADPAKALGADRRIRRDLAIG